MAAYGTTPDQHFAYWVTHDDDVPGFVIMDFGLVKAQGLRACQMLINGVEIVDVVYDLQNAGGYTHEQASVINVAAIVIYCPWTLNL